MENSLLNTIKSYFSEEVLQQLSSAFGEDKEQVRQGINVSIPSLLLGLQRQDEAGLSSVLGKAKDLFHAWGFGGEAPAPSAGNTAPENVALQSSNLINSIFGDKLSSVVTGLTNFLGVKSTSISGLLGASLPAVISSITKNGQSWDVSAVRGLLDDNKQGFLDALPGGLGLAAFGESLGSTIKDNVSELNPLIGKDFTDKTTELVPDPSVVLTPDPSPVITPEATPVVPIEKPLMREEPVRQATPPPQQPVYVEEEKKGAGLWWLLIPIAILALWFLFGKGCKGDPDKAVVTPTTDTLTVTDPNAVQTVVPSNDLTTRTEVDVPLSDGRTIHAYASGIEESLINFLRTDYGTWTDDQLKEKWFDFDNLNFETGTANVVPESKVQLENIALILQEFPQAKIKVGGYTDRTGDEAINKRLSQQRADAVKNFLAEKGLGAQVVGAEGYGSEFATVDAGASDAERAKDRRVAVSVRK